MKRLGCAVVIVVAAGGIAAPSASAGVSAKACGVQHARAAAAVRDCTIRGTVSGSWSGGGDTVTWEGTLVLAQQFKTANSDFPPPQPTFLPAAGSTVDWKLTGGSGDCIDSGSGTVTAADMTGALTIDDPKDGKWSYSLTVGPRHPGTSGGHVMPYTISCPSGAGTSEASLFEGMVFGYNGYSTGQAPANLVTDGATFAGDIHTPPGNQSWAWKLTGEAFPRKVSDNGIALIKQEEGLRLGAYEDQLHLCTIGYGHLILPEGRCGKRGSMHWTKHQAETALRHDLDKLMEPYVRKQSIRLGMNQCQYDALLSFAYNVAHGKGGESPSWKSLMAGLDPSIWQGTVFSRLHGYVYGKDGATGKRVKLGDLVTRREKEATVLTEQKCRCDGVTPPARVRHKPAVKQPR